MYPHERSLVKTYRDRPFALIGVNSDVDRDKIRQTVIDQNLPWRSFWNGGSPGGPIATEWNVSAWPTIYLIDHEGVIRHKSLRGKELDAALEELVAAAEAD